MFDDTFEEMSRPIEVIKPDVLNHSLMFWSSPEQNQRFHNMKCVYCICCGVWWAPCDLVLYLFCSWVTHIVCVSSSSPHTQCIWKTSSHQQCNKLVIRGRGRPGKIHLGLEHSGQQWEGKSVEMSSWMKVLQENKVPLKSRVKRPQSEDVAKRRMWSRLCSDPMGSPPSLLLLLVGWTVSSVTFSWWTGRPPHPPSINQPVLKLRGNRVSLNRDY